MAKIGTNLALAIGAAALSIAGGCASQPTHCRRDSIPLPDTTDSTARSAPRTPHRQTTARPYPIEEGGGTTWALVLNAPGVARAHAATDPSQFAEYARNDAALGARPSTPVLATNEWPQRARPSLASARRLRLETRADEILFFEPESRYRPHYYHYNTGGDGAWGFWP